jgi:hypothetical protein
MPLMLLVSTNTGSGTIRFREGNYLSPPITLSTVPQTVVFPRPRPDQGVLDEVLTMEGNATDIVTTSPITYRQQVYDIANGVRAVEARWIPFKTC